VAAALLTLLFASPFLKINGEQLVLLNIIERKFVFFGVVFLPQDFYIFVLAMLAFVVFIVLFTVVLGRIWCGWACPQTIFMEMVFRQIEVWIEGDHRQRKKLDEGPLTFEKLWKKSLKHTLFFIISFLIANIFLAYIIGSEELLRIIREPVSQHLTGFSSLLVFTVVFYLVFARLRELVCIVICPYGRLQGVLLDNRSLQVAYDFIRGEPRGKRDRNAAETATGHCVDCNLCVDVCPTGIDIRNGSQLECINCTACIDACNGVMARLNRAPNLIGFYSEEQIENRKPLRWGKRVYAYSAVLGALFLLLASFILRRTDIQTNVYRARGTLYQELPGGKISNLYMAELINKTTRNVTFELKSADPAVHIRYVSKEQQIRKNGVARLTFFLERDQKSLEQYKTKVAIDVYSDGKRIDRVSTTFIAPFNAY
jgi:cytochrome c oxidase accessory protein FixG